MVENNRGEIGGQITSGGSVSSGTISGDGNMSGGIQRNEGGTYDYRALHNKPSINGTELYGNYDEIDPTVPEWAKAETKPTYSAEEIGAVNAENEMAFDEIDRMFNAVFGTGV